MDLWFRTLGDGRSIYLNKPKRANVRKFRHRTQSHVEAPAGQTKPPDPIPSLIRRTVSTGRLDGTWPDGDAVEGDLYGPGTPGGVANCEVVGSIGRQIDRVLARTRAGPRRAGDSFIGAI